MRRAYTAEGLNLAPDSDELPLDGHLIDIDQDRFVGGIGGL